MLWKNLIKCVFLGVTSMCDCEKTLSICALALLRCLVTESLVELSLWSTLTRYKVRLRTSSVLYGSIWKQQGKRADGSRVGDSGEH